MICQVKAGAGGTVDGTVALATVELWQYEVLSLNQAPAGEPTLNPVQCMHNGKEKA